MERAEAESILDGDRETAVALLMKIGELVEANRRLEARVAELEQRLDRSSRNSSLPPSQDPPSAPPRPTQAGLGPEAGRPARARGQEPAAASARAGRRGRSSTGRSAARPARIVFGEGERVDAAAVQRHQVAELPPIAVTVSEHRLHRLRCPACAAETRAELPAERPALRLRPAPAGGRRHARRSATASPAATRSSSMASCSARALDGLGRRDRAARRRGARASRTPRCTSRSAPPQLSTSTRPAGACAAASARSGARSRRRRPSSGSPPTATSARPRRSSARTSEASPAPIAGGPTTTSTPSGASSAGRTWSGTSPPTARGSPPRRPSARPASRSPERLFAGLGRLPARRRPRPPDRADRPAQAGAADAARARGAQEHQDEVPPPLRQEPAQALAGAVDLHPHRRASSRPTTTPSAACAAPSSTASSPSAASPSRASARSSGSSPPRSPAAFSDARSSPTSPTSSTPASAATPSPRSPDLAGHLNAYRNRLVCRHFSGPARIRTWDFRIMSPRRFNARSRKPLQQATSRTATNCDELRK